MLKQMSRRLTQGTMTSPDKCVDPGPNEQRTLSGNVDANLEDDMLECQGIEDIENRALLERKMR